MKIVSVLCLIFFAFALPIVTITTAFDKRTSDLLDITRIIAYNIESGQYQPTGGDPIDGDLPPGYQPTGGDPIDGDLPPGYQPTGGDPIDGDLPPSCEL